MRMFFNDRNVRRVIVLAVFLGALIEFRHLAVLMVFFVLFERSLGAGARLLRDRCKVPLMLGVLLQIALALAAVAALGYVGWTKVVPAVPQIRSDITGQFEHVKAWMHARGIDHMESLQSENLLERAQH